MPTFSFCFPTVRRTTYHVTNEMEMKGPLRRHGNSTVLAASYEPAGIPQRRRRWIPPAVLALSCSLLVAPATPVLGVEGGPDHLARLSACVGAALEPAGFHDTEGSFAEDAADCLAHYGITLGTNPELGLFSPGQTVTRRQMALFLARAAGPAGVELPEISDQGFTDLDVGLSSQDAINQLVELGIMEGTSSTTFDPHGPVTRSDMARWLARFLSNAPTGPGGTDIDTIEPDDDHFTDVSSVDFRTRAAIRKIYELGVTQGTSAFSFSPDKEVTRGQMAVFISRALAHTHARPAGLTVQAADPALSGDKDVTVSVSYRDETHQPLSGRMVDVFTSTNPEEAFDDTGRCTSHVSAIGIGRACVMDSSDHLTSPSGYLRFDMDLEHDGGALRVWAWRGPNGALYDNNAGTAAVLDVRTARIPTALEAGDDMRDTARKLRLGETVKFTFRLVDADGDPVPKPGVMFSLGVERTVNAHSFGYDTVTKETGPDGSFEIMFRHADQDSEKLGDIAQLDLDVLESGMLEVKDLTTVGMLTNDGTNNDRLLDWSDEKGVITSLTLTVPETYLVASSDGFGARNTARASLTDQYGSGVGGRETIRFESTDPSVMPNGTNRTTNVGGVATLEYRRDSDSGATEWITAQHNAHTVTARQYWAARIPAGTTGSGEVAVIDPADNRAVIVAGNDVWLVDYTPADHLQIGTQRVRILTFKESLTVGTQLTFQTPHPARPPTPTPSPTPNPSGRAQQARPEGQVTTHALILRITAAAGRVGTIATIGACATVVLMMWKGCGSEH